MNAFCMQTNLRCGMQSVQQKSWSVVNAAHLKENVVHIPGIAYCRRCIDGTYHAAKKHFVLFPSARPLILEVPNSIFSRLAISEQHLFEQPVV